MRLKHLESALSSVQREFPNPNVTLEQYATNPSLTASVVHTALERNDVGPGCTVLDLGCGTGQLTLGCALVDSDFVWGVDCDPTAVQVAMENIREMELNDRISIVLARVGTPPNTMMKQKETRGKKNAKQQQRQRGRGKHPPPPLMTDASSKDDNKNGDDNDTSTENYIFPFVDRSVDTVITNPPFGTKPDKAGIDVEFLKLACRLATRAVYSFHKTSTRSYMIALAKSLPNVENATVIAEMKFDIPQTYKFHKKASVDVQVDLIRVQIKDQTIS